MKKNIDSLLQDEDEFTQITKNHISTLKIEANKLIKKANSPNEPNISTSIFVEYHPGYLYSTWKTHKTGNPARHIISQVQIRIYQTAK